MKYLMIITLLTLTLLCVSCGPGSPITPDSPYIDVSITTDARFVVMLFTAVDADGNLLGNPPMYGETTIYIRSDVKEAPEVIYFSRWKNSTLPYVVYADDFDKGLIYYIDIVSQYEGAPITGHAVFMN